MEYPRTSSQTVVSSDGSEVVGAVPPSPDVGNTTTDLHKSQKVMKCCVAAQTLLCGPRDEWNAPCIRAHLIIGPIIVVGVIVLIVVLVS